MAWVAPVASAVASIVASLWGPRPPRIEYRDDPGVRTALEEQKGIVARVTAELAAAHAEAKARSDPKIFKQEQQRILPPSFRNLAK